MVESWAVHVVDGWVYRRARYWQLRRREVDVLEETTWWGKARMSGNISHLMVFIYPQRSSSPSTPFQTSPLGGASECLVRIRSPSAKALKFLDQDELLEIELRH